MTEVPFCFSPSSFLTHSIVNGDDSLQQWMATNSNLHHSIHSDLSLKARSTISILKQFNVAHDRNHRSLWIGQLVDVYRDKPVTKDAFQDVWSAVVCHECTNALLCAQTIEHRDHSWRLRCTCFRMT